MDRDWLTLKKETKRRFATASWIPLRVSQEEKSDHDVREIGHVSNGLFGGSVGIPPEHEQLGEKLGWSDVGIGHGVLPYAYDDYYSPIDQHQYNDRNPIGVELVFDHPQPVVGGRRWIVNPDLVVALRLVKEGNTWVRPEEDFAVVIREQFDAKGNHTAVEIKREFLLDYLAARNLSLRMSYYMQRVENVRALEETDYVDLQTSSEARDDGRFELRVNAIGAVFGGSWRVFRAWRTDVDDEVDAPVLGPEDNENVGFESYDGAKTNFDGIRLEGEFWRDEWVRHASHSPRVRGDEPTGLPDFIVDTDGTRKPSKDLNHEEVGRWLWFRPAVANDLLARRGFSLRWYTAETGAIVSTSGYQTHFGLNSQGLLTVYAEDVAKLPVWEQRVWAAHNVAPEGKVSKELLDAQVRTEPADSTAVETELFELLDVLGQDFEATYGVALYTNALGAADFYSRVSRFTSSDRASLLRLAKELVRSFTDRLSVSHLRDLSTSQNKDKLGSNKLLESILAEKVGAESARKAFGTIVAAYDMRVGDAHPTSSAIGEALDLAGLDQSQTFVRQGQQLIRNYTRSIFWIGHGLFRVKASIP